MYRYFYNIINNIVRDNKISLSLFPSDTSEQIELTKIFFQQRCLPVLSIFDNNDIPKIISIILKKETGKNNRLLEKVFAVQKKFEQANIDFAYNKGPFLSYYVYGTPYARQFDDIDCFLRTSDMVEGCDIMESLGYKETLLTHKTIDDIFGYEKYEEARIELIKTAHELHYKDESSFFELKRQTSLFPINITEASLQNTNSVSIENFTFRTLNIPYTFLYLLSTVVENFYTYWGIYAYFCVRDILDFCIFIKKYSLQYEHIFIELMEKYDCIDYLMQCKLIVRNYLNEETYLTLPFWFRNYDRTIKNEKLLQNWFIDNLNYYINNKSERIKELYCQTHGLAVTKSFEYHVASISDFSKKEWLELKNVLSPYLLEKLPQISFLSDKKYLYVFFNFKKRIYDLEVHFNFISSNEKKFEYLLYDAVVECNKEILCSLLPPKDASEKFNQIGIILIPFEKLKSFLSKSDYCLYLFADIDFNSRKLATLGKVSEYCKLQFKEMFWQ